MTSRPCSKGYHDARPHFDAFPPSTRRAILEWIDAAKCPATRAARIVETAPEGERRLCVNQWRSDREVGRR